MGCGGTPSVLDPAGPQAEAVARLWWLFFWIGTAVFVLVSVSLIVGVFRGRGRSRGTRPPDLEPDVPGERRRVFVVSAAVGVTVLTLFTLLVVDFLTGRELWRRVDSDALTISVTGHQWWWEVRYEDEIPSRIITTANEIHVPTGQPVRLRLRSTDVIHSFWVPNLAGKKDLIPGHTTTLWFQSDREGEFHGQCAEFCGHQHAHMRFVVVAQAPSDFEAWRAAQLLAPPPPRTPLERRGQAIFMASTCVMCHAVQGTPARGRFGPDLSHVASRTRLGAATLPNTEQHLAGWIANPSETKPGVRMPPHPLSPADLRAVTAYLATLR